MDFINSFKKELFNTNLDNFNDKALNLFQFQAENNEVYKEYLKIRKIDPTSIKAVNDIPFLPISAFKHFPVRTGNRPSEVIFYSSGTSGQERSKHFVSDLEFYKSVTEKSFSQFYGVLTNYRFLALLPSYRENPSSSLIHMVDHWISLTKANGSKYINHDQFKTEINQTGKKIFLLGVTYALLDLIEAGPLVNEFEVVMETGGMKGRRKEMIKFELHDLLKRGYKTDKIHSEYGMTELLSQAYSMGNEIFKSPPWMRILTRELNDPYSIDLKFRAGGINIIDLANADSCAFIETQDIGKYHDETSFEVFGRFDNSDIRGCNLMYD